MMKSQPTIPSPGSKNIRQNYLQNLKQQMKMKIKPMIIQKNFHSEKMHVGETLATQNSPAAFQTHDKFEEIFQRGQKIGYGCNGTVYKCRHKKNNKMYALKVINFQMEHLSYLKESFYYMSDLFHKNIINYHALYLNAKKRQAFLVTQLFDHPPLSEFKKKLTENQLKWVIQNILGALDYLHSKGGICHRDIKPDNILYNRQLNQIKIIDFGISKKFKLLNFTREMMTRTGTQLYKAPEMINGGFYTQLVDLWAVGVTIFDLIAGETPFHSNYISQVNEKIRKGQINFAPQIWNQYSPFVKDLVSRLLKPQKTRLNAKQAKKHLWFSGEQTKTTSIYLPIRDFKLFWDEEEQIIGKSCKQEGDDIENRTLKVQKKDSFKKRLVEEKKILDKQPINSEEEFYQVVNSPLPPQDQKP